MKTPEGKMGHQDGAPEGSLTGKTRKRSNKERLDLIYCKPSRTRLGPLRPGLLYKDQERACRGTQSILAILARESLELGHLSNSHLDEISAELFGTPL